MDEGFCKPLIIQVLLSHTCTFTSSYWFHLWSLRSFLVLVKHAASFWELLFSLNPHQYKLVGVIIIMQIPDTQRKYGWQRACNFLPNVWGQEIPKNNDVVSPLTLMLECLDRTSWLCDVIMIWLSYAICLFLWIELHIGIWFAVFGSGILYTCSKFSACPTWVLTEEETADHRQPSTIAALKHNNRTSWRMKHRAHTVLSKQSPERAGALDNHKDTTMY